MTAGRVEQVGFPWDVYQAPQSAFVAQFIGTSNALTGRVAGRTGEWTGVDVSGWRLFARPADALGDRALAVFRPEAATLLRDDERPQGPTVGEGEILSREFLGSVFRYRIRLDGGALIHLDEHKPAAATLRREGERVRFLLSPADVMLFPAEGES
jgi:ABC-type Fe3+/spermidine/putrescine transport system ATPase subunit